MPNCKYCNEDLITDEMGHSEQFGDTIYEYMYGHCDKCGRLYNWTNIYELTGWDELEEEKGE